jgi:sulfite reductase alpha subunit-like flavoprotein
VPKETGRVTATRCRQRHPHQPVHQRGAADGEPVGEPENYRPRFEKDVRHIEIDLGDSGLRYQPGDALGVWYQNDPALVKELVELLWLKGDEPVTVDGKTSRFLKRCSGISS